MRQQNQGVKPKISHLRDNSLREAVSLVILGRKNQLKRFFSNFFENLIQPCMMQAGNIGSRRIGIFSILDRCKKPADNRISHSGYISAGSLRTGTVSTQAPSISCR